MGVFSKKKKGSKANNQSGPLSVSDRLSDELSDEMELRQDPEPPVRTINTLEQQLKMVEDTSLEDTRMSRTKHVDLIEPPPARVAAFHGPPRFDWIDIETNAAIKIQSIHRRNHVMKELEDKGLSTSAIRNRRRRRKAAKDAHPYAATQSSDTPSIFSCCAVGLAFGDATEDGDDAYRKLEKKKYEERQKQQGAHEEALRRQYMSKHGINPGKIVEALEVVD